MPITKQHRKLDFKGKNVNLFRKSVGLPMAVKILGNNRLK